ncbi:MAG: hypothetical protein FIB01_16220 [Gemmatimonadetes bacterium]|nr:hypothetical protein [Gemmatimonadota bacterium]
MPILVEGQTVRGRAPTLAVENRLEPGAYRFRLVVIDDEGNASAPAELVVRVVEALRPEPPVIGAAVPNAPVLRSEARATAAAAPADSADAAKPRGRKRRVTRPER